MMAVSKYRPRRTGKTHEGFIVPSRKSSWEYGITTVPSRLETTFPITLESLKNAGFLSPRLFIDGCENPEQYRKFGLEITTRYPVIRTHGNWILSLWELYLRNPKSQWYALFQDDFVTYKNLKQYLERIPHPPKSYLNLFTFPVNQALVTNDKIGWFESNQLGKGAVALVFSNEACQLVIGHRHMVGRSQNLNRGWKAVDGGIVTAFKKDDWKEYCHNPSLVQHIGDKSSMGSGKQPQAVSFRGEGFDALELLNVK